MQRDDDDDEWSFTPHPGSGSIHLIDPENTDYLPKYPIGFLASYHEVDAEREALLSIPTDETASVWDRLKLAFFVIFQAKG